MLYRVTVYSTGPRALLWKNEQLGKSLWKNKLIIFLFLLSIDWQTYHSMQFNFLFVLSNLCKNAEQLHSWRGFFLLQLIWFDLLVKTCWFGWINYWSAFRFSYDLIQGFGPGIFALSRQSQNIRDYNFMAQCQGYSIF